MSSIAEEIKKLEIKIAELRRQEAQGFTWYGAMDEEYQIRDDHEVVLDTEGNIAGIVQNVEVMKKYMASLEKL